MTRPPFLSYRTPFPPDKGGKIHESNAIKHQSLMHVASVVTGLLMLGLLFWPECRAAIAVWYHSTAYGHCFLVIPIVLYLIWDRRESLRGMTPQPAPMLAVLGLPLPILWLGAERMGIMEGRQIVFILTVELFFLTALGWKIFGMLMGPLLYLIFLVPFGAFLTPLLQDFTAAFIDVGLTLLGIPHFVNAMVIEISAGTFYVAEACAGLRFLIASVAFGVFFALLNYRSLGRRAVFMLASILIPVIANGFRALGIVVLGNILGSAQAAAADHILYGWIFFSIVMVLLVAFGLPFREMPLRRASAYQQPFTAANHSWAALVVLLIAVTGPAAAWALDSRAVPARLSGDPAFVPLTGCTFTPSDPTPRPPDQYTTIMTCPDRTWTLSMQAVSTRSTVSELNEVRRRLIGPLNYDEAITASLPEAPGWQSIVSEEPAQITAISSWLDGGISNGGFRQRFVQAQHSVLGADYEPLVITITTKAAHVFSQAESRAVTSAISQFLTLQPDLNGMVASLTNRTTRHNPE